MFYEIEFLQGESPGRRLSLTTTEITIGRDRAASLTLNSAAISELHSKIFYRDNIWHVADLESANGTALNGTPVSTKPMQIRPGDIIQMGPVV